MFGRRDIDFDDDVSFSQRFHVEAAAPASVRSLFDADVRAAFLAVSAIRLQCAQSQLPFMERQLRSNLRAELNSLVDDAM